MSVPYITEPTVKFETDLPPPVAAWFVEMHAKASPTVGDTHIRFRIEHSQYLVTIHREDDAAGIMAKEKAA